jgi:hypothetical protein
MRLFSFRSAGTRWLLRRWRRPRLLSCLAQPSWTMKPQPTFILLVPFCTTVTDVTLHLRFAAPRLTFPFNFQRRTDSYTTAVAAGGESDVEMECPMAPDTSAAKVPPTPPNSHSSDGTRSVSRWAIHTVMCERQQLLLTASPLTAPLRHHLAAGNATSRPRWTAMWTLHGPRSSWSWLSSRAPSLLCIIFPRAWPRLSPQRRYA